MCFTNDEFDNLVIVSEETTEDKNIENIDIGGITLDENPYCIPNINGKVKLVISKGFNEDLVTITKQ